MNASPLRKRLNERDVSAKYDQLVARLKGDYVGFRWLRGPKIHEYYQTRESLMPELNHRDHFHRILEIGCGPGTWTNLLSGKCDELCAVDISNEMVRLASSVVADNVRVVCADFLDESLGFDQRFDAIYGIRVFEYFANKTKAMRRIARVLNQGGVLCLIVKNPWYLPTLVIKSLAKVAGPSRAEWLPRAIRELVCIYADELHSHWVSASQLKRMLVSEGFDHVQVYPAVIGLFYSRFNSRIFAPLYSFFDFVFDVVHRKTMPFILWPLVESYLISGVKSRVGK